jgi:WD repeat-containing protein 40A
LTINGDYSIYAVGSASHVQLLDANNAKQLCDPVFVKKDIGIRSLNFRNNVLSVGTGVGTVLFYDFRAKKFLQASPFLTENEISEETPYKLQSTGGWILRNQTYYDSIPYGLNNDNSHAIYSHSYDPSGTKMLTAGGPLTVNLYGHYASIWK